jgi:hypothetical protein
MFVGKGFDRGAGGLGRDAARGDAGNLAADTRPGRTIGTQPLRRVSTTDPLTCRRQRPTHSCDIAAILTRSDGEQPMQDGS